ncbi:MAG TPA: nucleotide exchange factor GrpE [Rikenellaceae bacterium]|nr:nucleotide exchange factor GrpE [Rikenellaceae bacterium]
MVMKDKKKENSQENPDTVSQQVPVNEAADKVADNVSVLPEPADVKDEKEEKIAELNDRYLRLAAEFDNYRRRTAREKLELIQTASEDIIKGILPILDDCEHAIDLLKNIEGDHKAAIEGTELIYNKLYSYLESKGLKRMEVMGKELDTDFHEAVAQMPAPDKKHKNKIIDVAQQGYTLNGKVIRYAKVVIGV